MEAPKPISPLKFINEKRYKIELDQKDFNLIISSDNNESIKFLLSPLIKNSFSYEEIYNLEKLSNIIKIFLAFDSIDTIRNSIEQMILTNNYSIKEKNDNVEITLKVSLFEKLIDINLILRKKNASQKEINDDIFEKIDNLNNNIEKLNVENKELKNEIILLKEENKTINHEVQLLKEENKKIINEIKLLKEENKKLINLTNEIHLLKEENKKIKRETEKIFLNNSLDNNEYLKFNFKPGKNYTLSNNGLVATKTKGGSFWNCSVIGNIEIPKNKISKWKIRIKNIENNNNKLFQNLWNLLIGIGPDNINNEENFQRKCWSFICGQSRIKFKTSEKDYINGNKKLKNGDIVEVLIDRKNGHLSFAINGVNYGIACKDIPKEDELYPVINIYDQNQSIEILN